MRPLHRLVSLVFVPLLAKLYQQNLLISGVGGGMGFNRVDLCVTCGYKRAVSLSVFFACLVVLLTLKFVNLER